MAAAARALAGYRVEVGGEWRQAALVPSYAAQAPHRLSAEILGCKRNFAPVCLTYPRRMNIINRNDS